jgi:hypothetical protein
MKIKRFYFTLGMLVLACTSALAGGWPQPKKQGFFKLNQFFIQANQFYAPSGDILPITTTSLYTTSFYGEYGFTDRFTGILYFPFFTRSTLNRVETADGLLLSEGDQLNAVGDTDLTLKYGLVINRPVVLSASLTLGLPIGNPSGGDTQLLQSGDGELNQILSLEAGSSLYPVPLYASALVGYNNRTAGFSDEFRYGLEVGYSYKQLTALVRLSGIKSLNNGKEEILPVNGIFSDRLEFLALSPELIYEFGSGGGISASVGFALSGKRILANNTFSLGYFFKLQPSKQQAP